MLFQQAVEIGHVEARPLRDALLAAGGEEVGVRAFLPGHRIDQRDLVVQHLVVDARGLGLARHLAHAGHHAHQALHAAHLQHLVELHLQVVHVEQALGEALGHAFGLFGLEGLLRAFDEGHDVAHAEDAARDALGLEGLDRVHLLAQADEADRLAGDRAHRQRRAAATVAVHPGQDDARDADLAVEFGGDVDGVLAGEAVDHQQRLARLGDVADGLHLVHQDFVDMQASGGVEEDDVIAAEIGLGLGALGDLDGGFALDDGQAVHADLGAQDRQLLHRRRAVGVERGEEDLLAVLFLQPLRQLRGGGGLPRTLQADHQDRRGRIVDLQRLGRAIAGEDADQFVMDDLHDHLARGDRLGDGAAGGLFGDTLDEVAGDGQRNVSFQQGDTDLAQRGDDIGLGQGALFGQAVENAAKAFGEAFEHRVTLSVLFAPIWGGETLVQSGRAPVGADALTDGDPGKCPRDRKRMPPGNCGGDYACVRRESSGRDGSDDRQIRRRQIRRAAGRPCPGSPDTRQADHPAVRV